VNRSTLAGILLAVVGITVGLYLDGGNVRQMLQPTAALIVFGGTLGAVMVQFPFSVVKQAALQVRDIVMGIEDTASELIEHILRYSTRARRNGLLSLDAELKLIEDTFLRKALTLAVDGLDPIRLRQIMDLEMDREADIDDLIPKVFEAAGGFAPTMGILGAVIGLIQVMQRLENINAVGRGIAVAFVATIYGVGSANILFLPIAGRLKSAMLRKQVLRELILDGVISIIEKTNPRALEEKLSAYRSGPAPSHKVKLVAG